MLACNRCFCIYIYTITSNFRFRVAAGAAVRIKGDREPDELEKASSDIRQKKEKMGLLKKACRRVWKRLSSGKRACKPESYSTAVAASPEPLETVHLFLSATSTSALPGLRLGPLEASRSSLDAAPGSCCRPSFPAAPVVNVTASNNPRGGVVVQQAEDGDMLSAKGVGESTWNVSSESDSGVCVGGFNGDGTQEDDRCSVWSGAEEEEEEEDFECECEECSFARCETILEDWHISAKDLSLEKVLSSRQDERVYR